MKLDRNLPESGQERRGKYALVKIRELKRLEEAGDYSATSSVNAMATRGVVDFGDTADTDFFVIRLKDKYAVPALVAYGEAALLDGESEFAQEIFNLARQSIKHPHKQKPD